MSALSALLGLGLGLCLLGGRLAGPGAAGVCLLVGAFVAFGGAWAALGPALALAALLLRREEELHPNVLAWAPLTLCALTSLAVVGLMAGSTSPQNTPGMASIEALRGEPWLALGAAAILVLAALSDEEEAP